MEEKKIQRCLLATVTWQHRPQKNFLGAPKTHFDPGKTLPSPSSFDLHTHTHDTPVPAIDCLQTYMCRSAFLPVETVLEVLVLEYSDSAEI